MSKRGQPDVPTPENTDHEQGAAPGSRSAAAVFRSNLGAIGVMLSAVVLQVLGAILLKTIADHRFDSRVILLAVGIGAVVLLNLVRLGVWGIAHRRFPLSTTVPLASLFYPAMLIVALAYGDAVGARQVIGALLITSGTLWLSTRVEV